MTSNTPLSHVWQDVINDFLEMACFLDDAEKKYLTGELFREGVHSETIYVYPSFFIDGRIVIVCDGDEAAECLAYYPKKRRILKFKKK